LGRIELPRVNVEGAGHVAALTLAECGLDYAVREKPEVRPAPSGQMQAEPIQRGRRDLGEPTSGALEPVRVLPTVGIAVRPPRPPHRKETGVVPIAFFNEDVERPLPTGHNRETRRAETQHRRAGD